MMRGMSAFRSLGRVVVLVDDQDAALRFYRGVLGFDVLHDSADGGFRSLHLGLDGPDGTGIWLMPGEPQGEQPALVLYADDLDVVRARLAEHAVGIWARRTDDTGRSLHFRDPAGNVIVAAELP